MTAYFCLQARSFVGMQAGSGWGPCLSRTVNKDGDQYKKEQDLGSFLNHYSHSCLPALAQPCWFEYPCFALFVWSSQHGVPQSRYSLFVTDLQEGHTAVRDTALLPAWEGMGEVFAFLASKAYTEAWENVKFRTFHKVPQPVIFCVRPTNFEGAVWVPFFFEVFIYEGSTFLNKNLALLCAGAPWQAAQGDACQKRAQVPPAELAWPYPVAKRHRWSGTLAISWGSLQPPVTLVRSVLRPQYTASGCMTCSLQWLAAIGWACCCVLRERLQSSLLLPQFFLASLFPAFHVVAL